MAAATSTQVVVFTDIHFDAGLGREAIPHQRFRDGLRHAAKYCGKAGHIIITGDLADKGDIASYEMLKEALGEAHAPVLLLIGNHDNRENFLSVFGDNPVDENGFVQQAIDTPHARLVMLDTLNGPPYDYPVSHSGKLCEKRLEWLDMQLAKSEKPVVIFMHHPPHKTGFTGMDYIRLGREHEFYGVLERHGKVCQIIAGHVHRTIFGSNRGIPFAIFKSTQWQMPYLPEVTSAHISVDEPPAYGVVDIHGDGLTIHTEDFGLSDYETLLGNASP